MEDTLDDRAHSLAQIIYTSSATVPFSEKPLVDLLAKARRNNHALNISGMLVYDEGFFIQVLEGPEKDVDALFARIGKDPGHCNVRLLLRQQLTEKEYDEWSMGFVDTADLNEQVAGYLPYRTLSQTIRDKTRARKLIQMFQAGQWRQAVKL
jgi:hypothetical protein